MARTLGQENGLHAGLEELEIERRRGGWSSGWLLGSGPRQRQECQNNDAIHGILPRDRGPPEAPIIRYRLNIAGSLELPAARFTIGGVLSSNSRSGGDLVCAHPRFCLLALSCFPPWPGLRAPFGPASTRYTIEMNLGIPADASKAVLDAAGFQNQKKLECLTADELKGDIAKLMADELASDDDCKISNVKTTENKLTFTTTCVGDVQMVMSTEMTFGPDSFSGVTKGKDNEGRAITMKVGARRVGECK